MRDIYTQTKQIAYYIINNGATVRKAAKVFGIAKSTAHYDLTKRLMHFDMLLYTKVQDVFENNFKDKSRRGGLATKKKYEQIKKQK